MLGALPGVVSTKAGWLDKKEIVEVVFDPEVTAYTELLKAARCVEKPSTAYLYDPQFVGEARKIVGEDVAVTKQKPRDAKVSDQKYYLRKSAYHWLPLTEVQAVRLNAIFGKKQSKQDPRRWLAPSQLELLGAIEKLGAGREALKKLSPARSPNEFASYTAALRRELAKLEASKGRR